MLYLLRFIPPRASRSFSNALFVPIQCTLLYTSLCSGLLALYSWKSGRAFLQYSMTLARILLVTLGRGMTLWAQSSSIMCLIVCDSSATDSSTSNASPSELFSVIFFDEDISFPQTKPYPIFCTAGISGGHINPAVTFGLFLARKVSLIRAVMYMVAQCLGAICGVELVKAFQSSYYDVYGGGANELSTGYNKGTGLGGEIIGTFVLVYTVFSATDPKRSARDSTHQTQSFLSSWNISTSHCTWSDVPCDAFRHDCWIIISGKVYDVTSFLDNHPGGNEVLLTATGKDAPDDFEDVGHSDSARDMLIDYFIGEIDSYPRDPLTNAL